MTETFGQSIASSETAPIVAAQGTSYLSRLCVRQLARNQSIVVGSEAVRGAILWIDFQGFTAIVERFCREGAAGTERLSDVLNVHFGDILRTVEAFDGDLQFLAGDGALILWPAGSDGDLAGPVSIAQAAALEAQRSLRARRVEGTALTARCVIGAGSCRAFTVGGEDGRWFHVLAGDSIRQISSRSATRPGEVTLSPEALAVGLKPRGRSVGEPLDPAALPDPRNVERFLLPLVQSRLQPGHLLPEVRTVSVVFADLSGLGWEPDVARLQRAVSVLQRILREHDGAWYQLIQDDQGTYGVFVFGVPGTAREDDAVRAVRFSRAARQTLTTLLGEISCGVASGPLFCGDCGTLNRRQYALFGSPMNRAARLMASNEGLLIDEATYRQAERKLVFEAGAPMVLRGMGATPVFRGGEARRGLAADRVFVGRRAERDELTRRLTDFSQGQPMPVLTITGPPGIGKTALLADVSRVCPSLGLECAYSAASPFERRTPYFSLRQVALRLLGIDEDRKVDDIRGQAQDWLRQIDADPDLLPLIGPLLGHGLEETALTSQMTGAIRAENTNTLITNLLLAASSRRRWVVALDDAQWVDAASWTLVPRLREQLPNVGWILAFRELPERAPPELVAHARSVDLQGLSGAEVTDLLRSCWQVAEVADDVMARFAYVEGNPLFCVELAASLVKTGELLIDRGRGTLAPAASARTRTTTPLSLAALIQSRVDRLGPGPLLLIKLASVLGLSFEQASLRELAGVTSDGGETDARDYQANVEALLQDGCLQGNEAGAQGRLTFASATMQSVIYDLLPSRQQRRLHDAAGRTLEALQAADLAPSYGQLSHHFSRGENAAKAAHYSGLAAFQSLDGYANDDAIHLFQRALRHDASFRGSLRRDLDRARWYGGMAQANYSLTRPDAARSAYRQALRHAGHREPRGPLSPILGLIGFLSLRTWRSIQGADDAATPAGPRAFQDLALSLAVSWGTLDVWQGRLVAAAAKAFAAYRWARRSPSSGSRAEAIGSFGYFLGITPIRRMGESELRRAVTMSDLHGDLQSQASTRVMFGMYYALMGRSKKALPVLEEAQPIAKRLGAGLWKHRTRFQLGEALLSLAQFERATDVFQDAARLSRGAEPPIVGLANSFAGLAELRLGRVDAAVALVDGPEGAGLCTDAHLPMQRFVALALQAQTQLSDGRLRESFQTACRAEAISQGSRECDVFFVAMHGHAAVAAVHLALWRRSRTDSSFAAAGVDQRELRRRALRASERVGRFARLYPAARPCADFFAAACLELAARHTRAAKLAGRSLKEAREMTLPFDEWRALSSLGRVAAATERAEHQRDAQEIGARLGFSGGDQEITGDFVRWTRG